MAEHDGTQASGEEARWCEHLVRAVEAFAREMRGAVPEEFSAHARGSLREALLAIRSIIDTGVERLDPEAHAGEARHIEVE